MKKLFLLLILISVEIFSQNNWFPMPTYWEIKDSSSAYNIEAFDMNKDEHLDILVGNWNNTFVYYGGYETLDSSVDLIYDGRLMAICDYNGDGSEDMITMYFTSYDTMWYPGPGWDPIMDYRGSLYFYWGSETSGLKIDTVPDDSIPLPTLFPSIERFTYGTFETPGIQFGDFNDDGNYDLVFNSIEYVDTTSGEIRNLGTVYIYMGREFPIDSFDFMVRDSTYSSGYGNYFQVGDVNGDNFDDLLISSRVRTGNPSQEDSLAILHLYYGNSNFSFYINCESIKYISRYHTVPGGSHQLPWSDWFRPNFSVDDINGDHIDDVIIGGISRYDYKDTTTIHFCSNSGIDTIPDVYLLDPDTTSVYGNSGGISQNIGDFNNDGYNDFVFPMGIIVLRLGGPYINNINPCGLRGFTYGYSRKAVGVGDQNNDGYPDFMVDVNPDDGSSMRHVVMMLGQNKPVGVMEEEIKGQSNFLLYQNYPNPFNPTSTIRFSLPESSNIKLEIFNLLGEKVQTLINEFYNAGSHQIEFNSGNLPSGVYFYQLQAGNFRATKKFILLK